MKKKFLSGLLALLMCLSLLPAVAIAADSATTPDGTALTAAFLAENNNSLPTGSYYLPDNLDISQTILVSDHNVTLDLNGKVLRLTSSTYGGSATGSVFKVTGTLTLNDSAPTATHYFYSKTDSVLWRWDSEAEGDSSQPADTDEKTYHTVNGGVITGGSTLYGGGIHVPGVSDPQSATVTLTMNGGSIIGCTSSCGGGVFVGKSPDDQGRTYAEFKMNGGQIIGCAASSQGGGIFVSADSTCYMQDGTVSNCTAKQYEDGAMNYGGGVYNQGVFKLLGGSIKDCQTIQDSNLRAGGSAGGGIYNFGTLYLNGGEISGCSTNGGTGDGIFMKDQTLLDAVTFGNILQSGSTTVDLTRNACGNVKVVAHTCSFTYSDDDHKYHCTCGRSYAKEPVLYVDCTDGIGVNLECTDYTELTTDSTTWGNSQNSNAATWLVAKGDITIDSPVTAYGNVHLILCDNATLTITGGIDSQNHLYIHSQSYGAKMGKLTVSGAITKNTDYDYGIITANMTVDGGNISVTSPQTTREISEGISATYSLTVNGGKLTVNSGAMPNGGQSYAIYVNWGSLTVYGGEVTANGGMVGKTGAADVPLSENGSNPNTVNKDSYSYGIRAAALTVNDGTVTANGGNVETSISAISSYGIYTNSSFTIKSGTVTANGGSVKAYEPDGEIGSYALYAKAPNYGPMDLRTQTPAAISIYGGKLVANGNSAEAKNALNYCGSYGIYTPYRKDIVNIYGGTVEATAKAANTMAGIYLQNSTLTMNGGKITASTADFTTTTTNACTVQSAGLALYGLVLNDGTVTTNGGSVNATCINGPIFANSLGLSVGYNDLTINGGSLTATAGNATANGIAGSDDNGVNYSEAISIGVETPATISINDGTITATAGTASTPNDGTTQSVDIYGCVEMNDGIVKSARTDGYVSMVGALSSYDGTVKLCNSNLSFLVVTYFDTGGGLSLYADGENNTYGNNNGDNDGDNATTRKFADLLASGYAYYKYDSETTGHFLKLADVENELYLEGVYVVPCTHSANSGTCEYCGQTITNNNGNNSGGGGGGGSSSKKNNTTTTTPETNPGSESTGGTPIDFTDVKPDDYFADAVKWASANNITGGTTATTFGPHESCTRAQIVTFLWRVAGSPVVEADIAFTDVDANAYYAEAIRWAASLGLVDGYGEGIFAPNDTVTREQTVAILYRFAKAEGMDTTQGGMQVREFTDYESIADYAIAAMQWAVNSGIVKGENNNLLPAANCTRAQIVTMLFRMLGE